ncbi:hypothetical protein EVAR_83933_1 [Eumeta japonica]|uniref:Uncharacterized protein n=1 Tax=Eumeta variegata TaxID=151549 RepID=A0A4C1XSX8_EUMVA|nr:hypothetical protein EVAR_83933_1 [Eumeta japonica]
MANSHKFFGYMVPQPDNGRRGVKVPLPLLLGPNILSAKSATTSRYNIVLELPPRKPTLRISFIIASDYGFLWCVGKMMDRASMFRLVYCSTSFTSGGRSTTATGASISLQFIDDHVMRI